MLLAPCLLLLARVTSLVNNPKLGLNIPVLGSIDSKCRNEAEVSMNCEYIWWNASNVQAIRVNTLKTSSR